MRIRSASLLQFLIREAIRTKGIYFATLTTWVGVYALPLIIGCTAAALINKANSQPLDPRIWRLLALVVTLMALRALVLLVGLQLTFKLIFNTSASLKIEVLDRLLRRPSNQIRAGCGEILNRLRDDTDELGGLLEWTTDLLYRSVLSIIAVTLMVTSDLFMTIPVIFLLAGFFASVFLKNRVAALQAEVRKKQGKIGAMIADTLNGIRDLRLAGAIENDLLMFEQQFTERRHILIRQQIFSDLLSDLFRNLVLVGASAVLVTMSFQQSSGRFDAGKLVLFITYSSWLGQQMYFFGKILARYQNGKVSYSQLHELFESEQIELSISAEVSETLQELVVEGLTFLTPAEVSAPAPISFQVRPGEVIAITGIAGAGKSRLLHCLLGLNPFVIGSVRWNGKEIAGNREWMRAPRIGYAGQSTRFLRGTLLENIVLGCSNLSVRDVESAMRTVQLNPGSNELPKGLDTKLDSGDAGQLSGGQRQRLALARMLARPADLYLVDDCDSSLDGPTARSLWHAMKDSRPKAAWIVVSHNTDLLKQADHVVTMARAVSDCR